MPKTYTFICRFPICGKSFETDNPYCRYCCNAHRREHFLRATGGALVLGRRVKVRTTGLYEDRFGEGYGEGSGEKEKETP